MLHMRLISAKNSMLSDGFEAVRTKQAPALTGIAALLGACYIQTLSWASLTIAAAIRYQCGFDLKSVLKQHLFKICSYSLKIGSFL